ncbi:hypothetical protein SESBI_00791 [Sesbania bispinosa]|nr:hypothetical protein SESBI_00791 [Sesbania bispinosa]
MAGVSLAEFSFLCCVVQLLLEAINFYNSAFPDSIEDVTVRNETALHIAIRNEQFGALQVLLGWLKRTSHRGALEVVKRILLGG